MYIVVAKGVKWTENIGAAIHIEECHILNIKFSQEKIANHKSTYVVSVLAILQKIVTF